MSQNNARNATRSSATAEITCDALNEHSPLKVIRSFANRRGIYMTLEFLLALNSNLTSIFNRPWDITPRL